MVPLRMLIPSMQPNAPISRRLSASHGNLPSMFCSKASLYRKLFGFSCFKASPFNFFSAEFFFFQNQNEELPRRSISKVALKEADSPEKISEVVIENTEVGAGTSKQNVLDEMIGKLAEVNSDSAGMRNLRHFGKIIQVCVLNFIFYYSFLSISIVADICCLKWSIT